MSLDLERPNTCATHQNRSYSSHKVPTTKNIATPQIQPPASGSDVQGLRLPVLKTQIGGKLHPLTTSVLPRNQKYFLDNWPFPTEESRAEFVISDIGLYTCYVFPMALNERIELTCRMNTILFLADDILDSYSTTEAGSSDFYKQFAGIILGDPNIKPSSKVEEILSANLQEIRMTGSLGNDFCNTVLDWFKICTNMKRRKLQATTNFQDYLEYRTVDSGALMEMAIMRWCINDTAGAAVLQEVLTVQQLQQVAANHLFLVNDLFSYPREKERMKEGELGAALVNAVAVIMNERDVSEEEAMRWLEGYICELEGEMEHMIQVYDGVGMEVVHKYSYHLMEMMAGNLMWSLICGRYHGRLHG